jgi:hypothetical protein
MLILFFSYFFFFSTFVLHVLFFSSLCCTHRLTGEGADSPFGFADERSVNYFCPYHGKGPCDAFFGLMSRHLNAVVESRDIVTLRDIVEIVADWQRPVDRGVFDTSYKFLVFVFLCCS